MATNVIPASPCQPREAATPAGSLRVPAHGQVHALLAGKSTSLARRDQRFESPLLQQRVGHEPHGQNRTRSRPEPKVRIQLSPAASPRTIGSAVGKMPRDKERNSDPMHTAQYQRRTKPVRPRGSLIEGHLGRGERLHEAPEPAEFRVVNSPPRRDPHKRAVSVAEIGQRLGWLPHTVRAAITGLRHAGRDVTRSKNESGQTVYRLAPIETQDR